MKFQSIEPWLPGTATCGRRAMVTYLLAHFAKSQLWHSSTLLFGFFLTEACGLDARVMGLVMAGSLILNGVMDAIVGTWWSGSVAGIAAATRRHVQGAFATCLFFLLFCTTPLLDPAWRVTWAMGTLLAFRMAYSVMDVPQNGMVPLIAIGHAARCALLAQRNIVSALAGLIVASIAAPLLIGGLDLTAWLGWAVCLSILVCTTAWSLPGLTTDRAAPPAMPGIDRDRTASFAFILTILAVMMGAGSIFRSLEPYFAAYAGKGVGLLVWAAIAGMVSQPAWVVAERRLGLPYVLTMSAAVTLFAAIILLGPWRGAAVAGRVAGFGFGAGTSGLWLILWSLMMAHAASGRTTGHVGAFTCVSKLAQGAAMLLLGQVLATSSYRVTLADAWSAPSLLMAGALVTIAATSLALMCALTGIGRTASGGTELVGGT